MKVLVCGDRLWNTYEPIHTRLARLPKDTVIIHGAARGADTLAWSAAINLGLQVISVPAEWDKHGKKAGPIRNLKMLDMKPDLVIAFHKDLSRSKGTLHTLQNALKREIRVEVHSR